MSVGDVLLLFGNSCLRRIFSARRLRINPERRALMNGHIPLQEEVLQTIHTTSNYVQMLTQQCRVDITIHVSTLQAKFFPQSFASYVS